MQIKKLILTHLLFLLPAISFAAEMKILCDEPVGTRIDYFTQNTATLKNNEFLVGRDQVTGMQPQIIFNANNQDVSFVIGDATMLAAQQKTGNMKVILSTQEQISFTGMVNNAPVLATYYPAMKVLMYSQQSVWPGDSFTGARSILFYSKCQDLTPQPVVTTVAPGEESVLPPSAPVAPMTMQGAPTAAPATAAPVTSAPPETARAPVTSAPPASQ